MSLRNAITFLTKRFVMSSFGGPANEAHRRGQSVSTWTVRSRITPANITSSPTPKQALLKWSARTPPGRDGTIVMSAFFSHF